MTKLKLNLKNLLIFVAILMAFAQLPQATSAQTTSNPSSAKDTVIVNRQIIDNCGKALEELAVYDKLLESKETEIQLLRERARLEREKSKLYQDISTARKAESDARKAEGEALQTAIAAKDSQIKNLEKEVEILKKKKPSLMKKILQIAAGVGIGILLK